MNYLPTVRYFTVPVSGNEKDINSSICWTASQSQSHKKRKHGRSHRRRSRSRHHKKASRDGDESDRPEDDVDDEERK